MSIRLCLIMDGDDDRAGDRLRDMASTPTQRQPGYTPPKVALHGPKLRH